MSDFDKERALETLQRLKQATEIAIQCVEMDRLRDCTPAEEFKLSGFDFQVGDFRIVDMKAFEFRRRPLRKTFW